MKKKYIAKYLPVEEEIKEGDRYKEKGNRYKEKGNSNLIGIAKIPKDWNNPHTSYYDGYQKVELFLCSRDIKVGDKVYVPVYETYGKVQDTYRESKTEVEVSGRFYPEVFPKEDLIKPIGKISPEAKWVKEDDEFDEDEIHYPYATDIEPHYHCTLKEVEPQLTYPLSVHLLIKGPCTHYH